MWPAEHIFGSFMILVLIGLLGFGFWYWSRGTPNAYFGKDKWRVGGIVFGIQGVTQGFETWSDFSVGHSGWHSHLIVSLVCFAAAIIMWRKAKAAQ